MAQARQSGKPLPPNVALDSEGRMTTDPQRAETPLPVGGAKGSGLGFMLECLTSLMVGLPLLASALEDPAQRNVFLQNTLCIAIDPLGMPMADNLEAEVDRLARDIAAEPRAEGYDEILMPGERGDRVAARQRVDGITLPAAIWAQLASAAERRGVSLPEVSPA